jgi:hypothetical protein
LKKRFTIIDKEVAHRAGETVKHLPLSPAHEVIIREHKSSRSLAQNNTLHMWCAQISQEVAESRGKFIPADHWKEWLKSLFLGEETLQIGKKTITRIRPTSSLNVGEFAEFLTKIDHYSGSQLGICLNHPDEYNEAMGRKP